jgi:branched-chain amino acid transport system substrate-binding protein
MDGNSSMNLKSYKPTAHRRRIFCACLAAVLVWLGCPASALCGDLSAIEIGVIVAQRGKARDYGQAAIQGAQLAVDEINEKGGVLNRRLRLVIFDNKSTALNSREAATKAVQRGVVGVVGAVWSTHSLAIAPVLQKNKIPMISPGSTAPEVTLVGDYIFRTCYTDKFQGKLMADFAFQSLHDRRAAVLTNISEAYSETLSRYFSANFEAHGGRIVYKGGYKGSAIDFEDILVPLIDQKPEVIFVPGYTQDSGLIVKQARKLGIESVFMGGDAWETAIAQYAGQGLEGCYFSTFWHPEVLYPRNRAFLDRFNANFGEQKISAYIPLAYDAVWLLADAMRRCRSVAPENIRDALAATKNFQGATGTISFDANGDPINKGASIMKFEKDHWIFYKSFEPG